jgi:hypothetical protein
MRVIFATGYEAPPRTVCQDGLDNAVMLHKPYDEQQIATALKAATSKTDARQRRAQGFDVHAAGQPAPL